MADEDFSVSVISYKPSTRAPGGESTPRPEDDSWILIGKCKSHHAPIVSLNWEVISPSSFPRLRSIGEDKICVEYDLEASSIQKGLIIKVSLFFF